MSTTGPRQTQSKTSGSGSGAGSGSWTGAGLDTDVQFVKGVGERLAALLGRLGIKTVRDLLEHYPERYEDRTVPLSVSKLRDGQFASLRLGITEVESRPTRSRLNIVRVAAEDQTGTLTLVFFGQPWMKDKFLRMRGKPVLVSGLVRYGRMGLEMNSPEVEPVTEDDDPWSEGKLVPVYGLTEGLAQSRMRTIMRNALQKFSVCIDDPLPESLLDELDLMGLREASTAIHWSDSQTENEAARKRLVFQELYGLQIALAQIRRRQGAGAPGIAFEQKPGLLEQAESHLSFDLTSAQKRVIGEIWADMSRPFPMNRLLQGDVGSGKTVVALTAILLAVRNGYQSALMAPTEVLAEQHFLGTRELADRLGLRSALLIGSTPARAKEELYGALQRGDVDIVFGTHALVQQGVSFGKLGLVVIDEQHKFGVKQRSALRDKGLSPDMLVMTATPIPRTLTMTVYGDLDISILDELPPGRKPVKTHHKELALREKVYDGVRTILDRGGRAFVVCPLVEESEKLQAQAATQLAEDLASNVFRERKVGLLHGQMRPADKQKAIQEFREGELQVLVCTTVVEVGVDIPAADVVVVENAERYGLAQLHQLRGRVGRGGQQAYCILISDAGNPDAERRMQVMESTTDGFRIAEEDLVLRGPGEFFGVKQSGIPELKIADVIRDVAILELARSRAQNLVDEDPDLKKPENQPMGQVVHKKYHAKLLQVAS